MKWIEGWFKICETKESHFNREMSRHERESHKGTGGEKMKEKEIEIYISNHRELKVCDREGELLIHRSFTNEIWLEDYLSDIQELLTRLGYRNQVIYNERGSLTERETLFEWRVVQTDEGKDVFLVLGLGMASFESLLPKIAVALKQSPFNLTEVYLDQLLVVGNTNRRYLKVEFDGETLNRSTLQVAKVPSRSKLRQASVEFYQANAWVVEQSILPRVDKMMIMKGSDF